MGDLPLTLSLTIAIDTALSIGASGASTVLADKVAVRDAYDRLIIPGSHVKGRLRHACEEIARALGHTVCEAPRPDTMCPQFDDTGLEPRIPRFGSDGTETTLDDPRGQPCCVICQVFGSPACPSALTFSDLVYMDPAAGEAPTGRWDAQPTLRPGIGMDRRRGVVSEKRLYYIETTPAGLGGSSLGQGNSQHGAFCGTQAITGNVRKAAHAYLLLAGLAFIRNWGGGRSRGFGWGRIRAEGEVDGKRLEYDGLITGRRAERALWKEVLQEL